MGEIVKAIGEAIKLAKEHPVWVAAVVVFVGMLFVYEPRLRLLIESYLPPTTVYSVNQHFPLYGANSNARVTENCGLIAHDQLSVVVGLSVKKPTPFPVGDRKSFTVDNGTKPTYNVKLVSRRGSGSDLRCEYSIVCTRNCSS